MLALVGRLTLLISGAVSFHSDEAIIGLMARHINQGLPIPIFFYGQSYMGSLDALLVAMAFRVTGESVTSIRLVQTLLYLVFVGTTMLLAWRLTADRRTLLGAGLLVAIATPTLAVYTTASLGGYNELLVIGNLLLLAGWELHQQPRAWRWWIVIGALIGLGWWTHGLIVTYALPVGVIALLAVMRHKTLGQVAVAFAAFMVCSAPWWVYNLTNDWETVRFLLGGFGGIATQARMSIPDKLIGLVFIGWPGLIGARYSWQSTLWTPLGWGMLIVWIVILVPSALRTLRARAVNQSSERYLWGMAASFTMIFILSSFGADATGRYLLPLVAPLCVLLAAQLRGRIGIIVLNVVLIWQLASVGNAVAIQPPGLTTQFDPITDIPNTDDERAIAYLQHKGVTHGYATYWVAYRLAFLSHEQVTLSPLLPYKADLSSAGPERYPAYTVLAQQAEQIALVTAKHPSLEAAIEAGLRKMGIDHWQREQIGDYMIYYGLPPSVTPEMLGF